MSKVSVVKIKSSIMESLIKAVDLAGGGLGAFLNKSDTVMLKPNLNDVGCFTDIRLTEALIQLLFDFGIRKQIIAESVFGSQDMADMFFVKTGYTSLAKKYKIPLININKSAVVEKPVPNSLLLPQIKIARDVFEVDSIINLPVMKVHYATGITLSMKNLTGLLVGDEKRYLHVVGLNKSIVDLNSIIKPKLNIIDCITCMEKTGPHGGELFKLDLIIAGAESVETDYVGSLIMGFELNEVKHLRNYIEKFKVDTNRIEIVGEDINKIKRPFKKPVMQHVVPETVQIHEKDACSACMNTLLLSLKMLDAKPKQIIHIYLGKNSQPVKCTGGISISFGKCCKGDEFDNKIKGCPPYPLDLKNQLANR